jgi:hypothetical protein
MAEYLTVRQLSDLLEVPIETIRVRLHRANKHGYPLPRSRVRVINGRKVKEYDVKEFISFMNIFFRPPRNTSFYHVWKNHKTVKLD